MVQGWSITPSETSAEAKAALAKQIIEAGREERDSESDAFEGRDLSGLDLSNQRLIGLRLRGSCLNNTRFYNTILHCCDLRETDLSFADLRRTQIVGSSLANAKVSGARFCRSYGLQAKFHGLWWIEKVYVLPRGRVLCGAALESDIVDEKALKPYSVSQSIVAPPDKVPDGMVSAGDGNYGTTPVPEDKARVEDEKDEDRMKGVRARAGDYFGSIGGCAGTVKETGLPDFQYMEVGVCSFSTAELPHANFEGARISSCDWGPFSITATAKLQAGVLEHANLRNANLRLTNLTEVNFQGAKATGANFYAANISDAVFFFDEDATYPLPAKAKTSTAKLNAGVWARKVGGTAAKAVFEDFQEGDDDDGDDDDDDDADDEADEGDGSAMEQMAQAETENAIDQMGGILADSLPKVTQICEQARTALKEAIDAARKALSKAEGDDGLKRRLEQAVTLSTARKSTTTLAAEVEKLLQEELARLLDAFVAKLLPKDPAGSEELGGFLAMVVDDLRRKVEGQAQPHIKRAAGAIAARLDPKLQRSLPTGQRAGRKMRQVVQTQRTLSALHAAAAAGPAAGTAASVHPMAQADAPADDAPTPAPLAAPDAARNRGGVEVSVKEEKVMKGEAAWETYAKMLRTLLSDLEKALDNPTALVQAAVVRQGKGLLRRAGFERRLASLKKHTKKLEETTIAKLKELKDATPKHEASLGGFGAALDQKVRRTLQSEALKSVSRFATKTWGGLARNMLTKPTELVQNIDELEFLRKQIEKLADADVTETAWLDFFETWTATLALRSKLEAEVAQHIFDAILTDAGLLRGLGVAHVFRDARIESGRVPTFILSELKQGPAKHIKAYAYKYQQKLDRELARIRRIQTLQARLVALSGTAIASVFIGLSSLGSRIAYQFIYGDDAAQVS